MPPRLATIAALLAPALGGCGGQDAPSGRASASAPRPSPSPEASGAAVSGTAAGGPTFHRDIAPVVWQHCAPCHRAGEAAPFPLLRYEDVRRRARQIAIVTGSRFMPPWLPAPGDFPFANDRSIPQETIDLLQRWAEAGAPEGDPSAAGDPPRFVEGWQLGAPDLEVAMPEVFYVPPEGRDVYRNFVIPSPVDRPTWIRAVEFQPDNRVVLHHAVFFVDGTGSARTLDGLDPLPGYSGMDYGNLRIPDGQFVTWLPGKVPDPGSDDVAFLLEPHMDIVLQLHLRPSGKVEPIQVRLGLFEASGPPRVHPMTIRLWSRDIDIPAGDPAYVVEASYTLPVDVQVLAVYPHAHYLGDDLHGYAHLPDGETLELVHIPDWDFNWQEEYFYRQPVSLPRGTELAIHYTYDNTADNPLNPFSPPQRVVHGFQSSDEMAELLLSVLPSEPDRPLLWHDFVRFAWEVDLANVEKHAAESPEKPSWHHQIATYCLRLGRTAEAVRQYEALVRKVPGRANPLQRLGQARLADGDPEGAVEDLRAALEIDPRHVRAHLYLGQALQELGRLDEAEAEYRAVIDLQPNQASALTRLGEILRFRGRDADAREVWRRALAANPEHLRALTDLADLALEQGQLELCEALANRALHAAPDDARALSVLGRALVRRGRFEEARWRLELAVRFDPSDTAAAEAMAALAEESSAQ